MMKAHVKMGLDNLRAAHNILKGKRVGLITHPCGYDAHMRSAIDVIGENYTLTALFGCEHGIRGDAQGGARIESTVDAETNVPVYSLYGDTKSPTEEMLRLIDVMVIDLQDVGARFYTYLYTMAYAMIACGRAGIPVVVLDRINPIGGETVQGTVLDTRFHSFVGEYAVPTRYALTIGEFARFVKDELAIQVDLTVVPVTGWKRSMYLDDTDAIWTPPSPNMPWLSTAIVYTGTCVFEGTNISEGRGTTTPFELVGAPFIDARALEARMRDMQLEGMGFLRASFTPTFSKWAGELCHGVRLYVTDRTRANPFAAGLNMLEAILKDYPNQAAYLSKDAHALAGVNLLLGTDDFRAGRLDACGLISAHAPLCEAFKARKQKYHLYD